VKKQGEHIHKALVMMLFFIYAFGLIKPVLPLIKDVLAHTFFKTSHIPGHCCFLKAPEGQAPMRACNLLLSVCMSLGFKKDY
jgi:hypothetical protein